MNGLKNITEPDDAINYIAKWYFLLFLISVLPINYKKLIKTVFLQLNYNHKISN